MKKKLNSAQEIGLWNAFYHYREKANSQGVPWELTFSEFVLCVLKKCALCKTEPAANYTTVKILVKKATATRNAVQKFRDRRSHLDRLSRAAPFTADNIIPVCNMCFRMRKYLLQSQLDRLSLLISNLRRLIKKRARK